jgi:hypothetical protein
MGALNAIRGRESLTVVFWLYCVVGGWTTILLLTLFGGALSDLGLPAWSLVAIATLEVLYLVWAHVSLWTCAFNSQHRVYGYAARVYAVAFVVLSFYPLFFQTSSPQIEVLIVR